MRHDLSTRSLALIAVCLAVSSAAFCWHWAMRHQRSIERYDRAVAAMESRQEDLEFHLMGLAALMQRVNAQHQGGGRLMPSVLPFEQACREMASSLTLLNQFETARADSFLLWYYRKMKAFHMPETAATIQDPKRDLAGRHVLAARENLCRKSGPFAASTHEIKQEVLP
ncbi:MAG: hypothetical protein N3D11_06200 [Candidatus Sumerlaeia bacterium]|nr:hypothetical protein [Candidatus Sumerlaeia bacterium]